MNKQNKILGPIGLATKAGKISFGTEAVKESVLRKKLKSIEFVFRFIYNVED